MGTLDEADCSNFTFLIMFWSNKLKRQADRHCITALGSSDCYNCLCISHTMLVGGWSGHRRWWLAFNPCNNDGNDNY